VLGLRLEGLERHPGSDLWQMFITDYEDAMVAAAAATGAVMVASAETSQLPWLQGSAWLVARDRVVTNRHVVVPEPQRGVVIAESDGQGGMRLRQGVSIGVRFDADDRTPAAAAIQRQVTGVLFVAPTNDPVDVAVLSIEPVDAFKPLALMGADEPAPSDLFVVGHPGLMAGVPSEVQAVFGNPDGRKRVSFGKQLSAGGRIGILGHDASTIGGYSGGPVVRIKGDAVAGLHYYGNPASGNLAVTAAALRAHKSYAYFGAAQ
jgi:S1-C subfamily serine protease